MFSSECSVKIAERVQGIPRARVHYSWLRSGRMMLWMLLLLTGGISLSGFALSTAQIAKLTASDGTMNGLFGNPAALSADGNTAVIGSNSNSSSPLGEIYVFVKDPNTGWPSTQTAKLSVIGATAFFGRGGLSISSDGSTVVALQYTNPPGPFRGYVFVKPNTGWADANQTAVFKTSDDAQNSFSQVSISSDGSTIVAGVQSATGNNNANTGADYVFVAPFTGTVLNPQTESAKLIASNGVSGDEFGDRVAISGDGSTVVSGGPVRTVGSNTSQGMVYVHVAPFTGTVQNPQTENAQLTASDGGAFDQLGYSVSISGDGSTLAASAIGKPYSGAIYVFQKPGTGWATTSAFAAELIGTEGGVFGAGVGISSDGNNVVTAAPFEGNQGAGGAGYLFVKPTTGGWATTSVWDAKFSDPDATAGDGFGCAPVSSNGSTVLCGAGGATVNGNTNEGAAYIFGVTGLPATTSTVLTSSANPSLAGQNVTFTATVSPQSGPTGSVVFKDGTNTLCSGVALSNGMAMCSTSTLTAGNHSITATYSGDSAFRGSTSNTVTQAVQDFTISASPSSQTLRKGNTATYMISLTSVAGFNHNVALSCSGAPANSTCTISPTSVAVNGTATAMATVTLSTAKKARAGTSTITFTGTFSTLSHSTTVTLTITTH